MKQTVYALSPLIAGLGSCLSIWCDDMAKQIVFVIMCDLEKAIGAFHSFEGLILLGFIPLSGMEASTEARQGLFQND